MAEGEGACAPLSRAAAGVLYPIGVVLPPAGGAVLMSLSTITVAINACLISYQKKGREDETSRPAG